MTKLEYVEAFKLAEKIMFYLGACKLESYYIDKIKLISDCLYKLSLSQITDNQNRMPQLISNFISEMLSSNYNRITKQTIKDMQKLNAMFNHYPVDNMYEILPEHYTDTVNIDSNELF